MKIIVRIIVDIFLLVCCFVLPWWLATVLAVVGIAYFTFPEIVFGGVILDILYSPGGVYIFHVPAFFTILFCVLLCVFLYLRTRMKFY
jgi:hypothetical protein